VSTDPLFSCNAYPHAFTAPSVWVERSQIPLL
jgi:hypothetical protein